MNRILLIALFTITTLTSCVVYQMQEYVSTESITILSGNTYDIIQPGTVVYLNSEKNKDDLIIYYKNKKWRAPKTYTSSFVTKNEYYKLKNNTNSYSTSNYNSYTPTPSTSNGGSVSIKGYYRKDGTYVKPHTRRAPSRRK